MTSERQEGRKPGKRSPLHGGSVSGVVKWLLFIVALLLPGFLYATTSPPVNVPIQITPLSSTVCNSPTAPSPAQSAGFTTLAGCWDFTQQSAVNNVFNGAPQTIAWTNLASWLDCGGNSGPQWNYANSPSGHCTTAISETTDPLTGKGALDLQWSPALGTDNQVPGILTVDQSNHDIMDFPYAYFEETFRLQPNPDQYPTGANMAWWTHGATNHIIDANHFEIDFLEVDPGWFIASGIWQWDSTSPSKNTSWDGGDAYPNDTDPRQNHTWGTLVTGDATSVVGACTFFDGNFLGCASQSYASGSNEPVQRYPLMTSNGCNSSPAACPSNLQSLDMYISSIRVFSCANWQNSMCYTTPITSNP